MASSRSFELRSALSGPTYNMVAGLLGRMPAGGGP